MEDGCADFQSCYGTSVILPTLDLISAKPKLQPVKRDIPCSVCGETPTLFRCGNNICEACKKFFTRNVGNLASWSCVFQGNCDITKIHRSCQYCRLKKCFDVGLTSRTMKLDVKQLQCKICGASAAGFHFGVLTCESCKGFYRRSMKDERRSFCAYDGKCEIVTKANGKMCKACRLAKCIYEGMSLQAASVGRYSNYRKYHLEQERSQKPRSPCTSVIVHHRGKKRATQIHSPFDGSRAIKSPRVTPDTANADSLEMSTFVFGGNYGFSMDENSPDNFLQWPVSYQSSPSVLSETFTERENLLSSINLNENINLFISCLSTGPSDGSKIELEDTLAGIVNASTKLKNIHNAVPSIQYDDKNHCMQSILEVFSEYTHWNMAYIKKLPNFNLIPLKERVLMFQNSSFQINLAMGSRRMVPPRGVFLNFTEADKEILFKQLPHCEKLSHIMTHGQRMLHDAELDTTEFTIFLALVVFMSSSPHIRHSSFGDFYIRLYNTAMHYLVSVHGDGASKRLIQLLKLVDILHALNNQHHMVVSEYLSAQHSLSGKMCCGTPSVSEDTCQLYHEVHRVRITEPLRSSFDEMAGDDHVQGCGKPVHKTSDAFSLGDSLLDMPSPLFLDSQHW